MSGKIPSPQTLSGKTFAPVSSLFLSAQNLFPQEFSSSVSPFFSTILPTFSSAISGIPINSSPQNASPSSNLDPQSTIPNQSNNIINFDPIPTLIESFISRLDSPFVFSDAELINFHFILHLLKCGQYTPSPSIDPNHPEEEPTSYNISPDDEDDFEPLSSSLSIDKVAEIFDFQLQEEYELAPGIYGYQPHPEKVIVEEIYSILKKLIFQIVKDFPDFNDETTVNSTQYLTKLIPSVDMYLYSEVQLLVYDLWWLFGSGYENFISTITDLISFLPSNSYNYAIYTPILQRLDERYKEWCEDKEMMVDEDDEDGDRADYFQNHDNEAVIDASDEADDDEADSSKGNWKLFDFDQEGPIFTPIITHTVTRAFATLGGYQYEDYLDTKGLDIDIVQIERQKNEQKEQKERKKKLQKKEQNQSEKADNDEDDDDETDENDDEDDEKIKVEDEKQQLSSGLSHSLSFILSSLLLTLFIHNTFNNTFNNNNDNNINFTPILSLEEIIDNRFYKFFNIFKEKEKNQEENEESEKQKIQKKKTEISAPTPTVATLTTLYLQLFAITTSDISQSVKKSIILQITTTLKRYGSDFYCLLINFFKNIIPPPNLIELNRNGLNINSIYSNDEVNMISKEYNGFKQHQEEQKDHMEEDQENQKDQKNQENKKENQKDSQENIPTSQSQSRLPRSLNLSILFPMIHYWCQTMINERDEAGLD